MRGRVPISHRVRFSRTGRFWLIVGVLSSLATFARVNKYGFIETPYRKIVDGKVTNEVVYLSAMEEQKHTVAQANADLNPDGSFIDELISARSKGTA